MGFRKDKKDDGGAAAELLQRRLDAINLVSHTLLNQTDLDGTLSAVVNQLVKKLNYINPSIYLLNDTKTYLTIRKASVPEIFIKLADRLINKSVYDVKFSLNEDNLLSTSIKNKAIQISESMHEILRPYINKQAAGILQTSLRVNKIVVIPIFTDDEVIGCLAVARRGGKVSIAEKEILTTFSDQISIAISNSKTVTEKEEQLKELQAKNSELAALYNLTSNVSQSLDPQEVAQAAVESIPQDEMFNGAIIALYNEEKRVLVPMARAQNSMTNKMIKLLGPLDKYEIDVSAEENTKSPIVITQTTGVAQFTSDLRSLLQVAIPNRLLNPLIEAIQVKSVAIFPLQAHHKIIGVIVFFIKQKTGEEIEIEKKQLLNTFAIQIAIALENAKLFAHAQKVQEDLQTTLDQLKEARRKERDMLDVMGHELRTPISIVKNALAMLQRELDKHPEGTVPRKKLEKYLTMGTSSVKREVNVIETLLSATKVDGARLEFSFTKVDMKDVIKEAIDSHHMEIEKHELNLDYKSDLFDNEILAYADRTRSQEILNNLVSNAIKYAPGGQITIQAWTDSDNVWVKVADDGPGIGAEDLKNLGKKFFRAKQYTGENEDTRMIRPGGTGLGLYVTFELIRAMQGVLYINSQLGEGTSFTFSLPKYRGQKDKRLDQAFDENHRIARTHIFINEKQPEPLKV